MNERLQVWWLNDSFGQRRTGATWFTLGLTWRSPPLQGARHLTPTAPPHINDQHRTKHSNPDNKTNQRLADRQHPKR